MREGGKLAFHLPLLCFHPAAIREQLFGCCSEQVHCLIRLCHIIASTKWIQPCFIHIPNHAVRWQLTCLPLAGPLSPVCHVGFLSILAVSCSLPPFFSSSCSVTPTPSLRPSAQCNVTTRWLQIEAASKGLLQLHNTSEVSLKSLCDYFGIWEGYINNQKRDLK